MESTEKVESVKTEKANHLTIRSHSVEYFLLDWLEKELKHRILQGTQELLKGLQIGHQKFTITSSVHHTL